MGFKNLFLWVGLAVWGQSLVGCSGHSRFSTLEPAMTEERWFEPQRRWVISPAYYAQAVAGHLGVVAKAQPMDDWLAGNDLTDTQKQRLQQAQAMRRFAVDVLGLPNNSSHTRYADLQRNAVVWNVVATPALSLELHQWCFPFAGCVGYRGFYRQQAAQAFAARLPAHWDVKLYPVSAYSTLGWTQWMGGDPLLNTMLAFPEIELAELLFHELAHQQVYVKGDTTFNESYATAVERLGAQAWRIFRQAEPDFAAVWAQHQQWRQQRKDFQSLVRQTRADLERLYAQRATSSNLTLLEQGKADVLQTFERRYAQLQKEWGRVGRFDAWVQSPNNVMFALQHSYTQWVPAFEQLFADVGGDWPAFHAAVKELSRLPQAQRDTRLQALQQSRQ
jgi:predicted aminopeptidase